MNYRILGNTGLKVSTVGFGCAPLGNEYGDADIQEVIRSTHAAIDHGINFFDTSPYYGRTLSEERLGLALEGRRQSVVLATKCGRYDKDGFDFSAKRVFESIDESLRRLRTDYIDLWQAHDIEFGDLRQVIEETIPAMREVQRQGKARFIGITSYQLNAMRRVASEVPVDSVLSYCRFNLMIDDMDRLLTPFAKENGIGLINAAPVHMGVLTSQGPRAWHPGSEAMKKGGAAAAALCASRGVDVAAIALQYCLRHPYAASTLVGMSTIDEVERNMRAAEAAVDDALIGEIRALVAPVANQTWAVGRPENEDYAEDAQNRRASSLLEVHR